MNTDNAILKQVAVFFRIPKSVPAMAALRRSVVCMRIQIHCIDLCERNHSRLIQSLCRSFDQGVSIVMTTANYDGDLSNRGNGFDQVFNFFINEVYGMTVGFKFFFRAMCIVFYDILNVPEIKMAKHED